MTEADRAHGCKHGVSCVRRQDILRALWVEGIVPQQEVQEIIRDLQIKARMKLTQPIRHAIFAECISCPPALAIAYYQPVLYRK